MAGGGGGVDGGAELIGEPRGGALAGGAAAREAVEQGGAGGLQQVGRVLERFVERHGATVNPRHGRRLLVKMQEKRFRKRAGALDGDDALAVELQGQVVADAAAVGARDIGHS